MRRARPALPPAPAPPRGRWRRLLLLALLPWGVALRAGGAEEPPFEAAPVVLGEVVLGSEATAAPLLAEAEQALARGEFATARERLSRALSSHADALVPVPPSSDAAPGLHWTVRRVVEQQAGRLPPEEAARLAAAHASPQEELLAAAAARGDARALERLTALPALSARALESLPLAAEVALEQGALAAAAERFERWLSARPAAPAPERAPVLLRLVDALEAAGDQGGLARLRTAGDPALDAEVRAGGETLSPRLRLEAAMLRLRRGGAPPAAPDEEPPADLEGLWQADLSDPSLRGGAPPAGVVVPGAAFDGEQLVVSDGRRVSAFDALTGHLRWRFPAGPQGWEHAPAARLTAHDVPLRTVDLAGGLVLTVLGDPPAQGTFVHAGQNVDAEGQVRDSRARLVALDAATGALRWATGLADERHPALGDRHTAVASPPCVHGDAVLVLLGRRFGAAEHALACLDLASGRPRWVTPLGSAESGRGSGPRVQAGREERAPVMAAPWGAAPSVAHGEVCVTPHAGFAAGLDAATGRVRWLRTLPCYAPEPLLGALEPAWGFSARNRPVAVPGAWVLAPMDAPVLLALEQGTGRLRWRTQPPPARRAPPWRDLVGLAPDAAGQRRVRLAGLVPGELDPADGTLLALAPPFDVPGAGWPGRVLDLGAYVARASEGRLQVHPWPGRGAAPRAEVPLTGPLAPVAGGDLVRAGPLLAVVEPQRVSVYAPRAEGQRLRAARAERSEPAERAAAVLREAVQRISAVGGTVDGPALTALAEAALPERGAPADVREDALRAAVSGLSPAQAADGPALALLGRALAGLPEGPRAALRVRLAEQLLAAEADAALLDVLAALLDAPSEPVEVERAAAFELDDPDGGPAPRLRLRLGSDLAAGRLLADLRARAPAAEALGAYDARRAAEVDAALAASGPAEATFAALEAAVRRAAGTPAAVRGREALHARARAAGEVGRAARLAAALRLDPPAGLAADEGLAWAARWQQAEVDDRLAAGDPDGARRLLLELQRWAPAGHRDAAGRRPAEALADLRAQHGFALPGAARPARRLDVWEGGAEPGRDEVQALTWLGVHGPGAARLGDRLLLSRGLQVEVWDAGTGRRTAVLPAGDEGWFGGGLQDVTPWLPERGVRVATLSAGEPADRSGVFPGDWITSWAGQPLEGLADFMGRIARAEPGVEVAVDVRRRGERVLGRLTPGRRPVGDGVGVLTRTRLYAAADGRVLVPSRTALAWVDAERGRRDVLWTWDGRGTVQRVDVAAGCAYVLVRRQHEAECVAAVRLADGRELWRRDVDGAVLSVAPAGPAVLLELDDAPRLLLLDAEDGGLRAEVPLPAWRVTNEDATRVRASACAADAAGRVLLLRPDAVPGWTRAPGVRGEEGPERVALDQLNPVTGELRALLREDLAGEDDPALPAVAADALVAVPLTGERIDVLLLDPRPGAPARRTSVGSGDLFTEERHHGYRLNAQSRVLVAGTTLYVLRNRDDLAAGANVRVFSPEIGRGGLRMPFRDFSRVVLPSSTDLRVLSLALELDGLLLSAASLEDRRGGGPRRAALWVPSAELPEPDRDSGHSVWEEPVRVAWRSGAVRGSRWLVLPTDRGAELVPLEPAAGR